MRTALQLLVAYLLLACVGALGWLWTTSVDRHPFSADVLDFCAVGRDPPSGGVLSHTVAVEFALVAGSGVAGRVQWPEPDRLFERALAPLRRLLDGSVRLNVKARVVHSAPVTPDQPLRWLDDDSSSHAGTDRTLLRLVVFIPPKDAQPMRVLTPGTGRREPVTEYQVPQWGAVLIRNADPYGPSMEEALPDVRALTAHLALMLGVPLPGLEKTDGAASGDEARLAMQRLAAQTHAARAARDVCALLNVTRDLPQVPVRADVTHAAALIVHQLQRCEWALSAGRTAEAAAIARQAAASAEALFFEPAMIAQLHFPPEHRQALYLPLLLPAAVPLVTALLAEGRRAVQRRRASRTPRRVPGG